MGLYASVLSVIFLAPSLTFASGEKWHCVVEGQPEGQSVTFSLEKPILDYDLRYVASNGQVVERHESLLTESVLTTYKVPRANCAASAKTSDDGKRYDFGFACGAITGYLRFDSSVNSGAYSQSFGSHGPVRFIKFAACSRPLHNP